MRNGRGRIVGLLVCLACLGLLARSVQPSSLVADLRRVQPLWLAPALLSLGGFLLLNATRWSLLLRPLGRYPVPRLLRWQLIGYLGNTVLPVRAGDLGRGLLAGGASDAGAAAGLATILLEKTADVLVLVAALVLSILLAGPQRWVGTLAAFAGAMAACGLLAVMALSRMSSLARLRRLRPLARPVALLDKAAAVVPAPRDLPPIAAVSVALWLASALNTWCVLRAAGIAVGFPGALLVTAGLNLALAIPSGPASLGSYELAIVALLSAMGVATAPAQVAALAMRAAQYLPPTLLGVPALAVEGLRLHDLRLRAARPSPHDAPGVRPALDRPAVRWLRP